MNRSLVRVHSHRRLSVAQVRAVIRAGESAATSYRGAAWEATMKADPVRVAESVLIIYYVSRSAGQWYLCALLLWCLPCNCCRPIDVLLMTKLAQTNAILLFVFFFFFLIMLFLFLFILLYKGIAVLSLSRRASRDPRI